MKIADCAGLVLCGGRSRRMTSRKEFLPFGPELMLQRVVRLLGEAVRPVLVAAGPGGELPPLPPEVEVVEDLRPDCGPLAGMEAALLALRGRAQAIFVTGCDVPFLKPGLIRRIVEFAPEHGIAAPYVEGMTHTLTAVYPTEVLAHVQSLLASARRRPIMLFDLVPTRRIEAWELTDCDPQLQSLCNVNSPADYQEALMTAGFAPPHEPPRRG